MSEFHILDGETSGNSVHIRQYDSESLWTVEIVGAPKIVRKLVASGANVQRSDEDSTLFSSVGTEQVVKLLCELSGFNVKLAKKTKRQLSPEVLAAKRERASLLKKSAGKNIDKNGTFIVDFSQDSMFDTKPE